jgi:hypothetical protein
MSIVLMGSTSGSCTLQEQAVAGTSVLTLPVGTGTVVANNVNSAIVSGTAQNSTSGTAIDFTGIPSWAKRITILFNGVSLSGTDDLLLQIGDSGGIETTGYNSTGGASGGGTQFVVGGSATTTGFLVFNNTSAGSVNFNFPYVLTNFSGNVWVGSYSGNEGIRVIAGGGIKTLSDVLTQVRITRTGTNTFDAGSINILYE